MRRIAHSLTVRSAALLALGAVLVAGLQIADGPATRNMVLHVLLMSVIAPLAAAALVRGPVRPGAARGATWKLFVAAALQAALFLAWHAPAAMSVAMHDATVFVLMHSSLFVAALAFWLSVDSYSKSHPWGAIAALIVSGKLFCLLAVLLVFSPRAMLHTAPLLQDVDQRADQQTAGLVMLSVCPLAYVAIAIAIASRWLAEAAATPPARQSPSS